VNVLRGRAIETLNKLSWNVFPFNYTIGLNSNSNHCVLNLNVSFKQRSMIVKDVLEGGRRPPKRFLRLGGRIMVAPTQEPPKKKNRKKKKKSINTQQSIQSKSFFKLN